MLLKLVMGLVFVVIGKIEFGSKDLSKKVVEEWVRVGIGYVF